MSDVLIERISVWFTARLAASENVIREPASRSVEFSLHLVVDHDRVVERETENRQQPDDRRRRHLEADERIHAGRDDAGRASAR